MQLAKNVIDLGLSTNNLEPMLRFWQQDAGLRFDHVLPVRRGRKQYRHDALGSVIKLNHHAELLPAAAASGYRELIIAREGVEKPGSMVDPDGNRVRLVPPAHDGITQLAIRMGVRSLSEHRRFYGDIFGFADQPWSGGLAFRLGDSLLLLEEDRAATVDPARQALGWRYITLQVADIDTVHNDLRSKGVREGLAPVTLGSVARISMILDPDGNWIELSRPCPVQIADNAPRLTLSTGWPPSFGLAGRFRSESVAAFRRNRWPLCLGFRTAVKVGSRGRGPEAVIRPSRVLQSEQTPRVISRLM